MPINPETFQALNTADLLNRAAQLQFVDPTTATLLRWAALEIDSLRDASLEAHGVTIIDGGARPAADEAVHVAVTLIEARPDPVYGHTFKLPACLNPKGARA